MKNNSIPVHSSLLLGQNALPKDPTGEWKVIDPSRSEVRIAKCVYAYSQIDSLVNAAHENQKAWANKNFQERHRILIQSIETFISNRDLIIEVAQHELGRSLEDMKFEFAQIEKWAQAFEKFTPLEQEPRGVTAVVSSYVSPLLNNTHFVFLNLLAGNAVVLKPSERAALTVLKWAEYVTKDESIAKVFQVLVGEKEMGRRLICHDQISTVIFMGSFEVGMRVKQDTLSQPAKEVLLYLGAKNAAILCEDFPKNAAKTLIQDCFLSTGQNCRSVSVIFVHESKFQEFLDEFHQLSKEFKIGPPLSHAYMGPFIDEAMLDRHLKFVGISEREGGEVLMRGKPLTLAEKGHFATPTLAVFQEVTPELMKKSISLQAEILAPHVSVIRYESYENMVQVQQQMHYGLCASIWGANQERMKQIARDLNVGEVVFNQSLLEVDLSESFQARKKSGNHAHHGFKLYEQLTVLNKKPR